MRLVPLLLASAAALCLGTAEAAPDDTVEEGLVVVLKNGTDEAGKPKGCFFSASGKTMQLMNGTRLVVTLAARGRSREFPVKILQAVVEDNAFEVSFPWTRRIFAPLLYQVVVELKVKRQPKAIQNWIMSEYGFSARHQEVLDRKMIAFDGEEARAAFAISNIAHIKSLVLDLEEKRVELAASAMSPATETEGWADRYLKLNQGIVDFRAELDAYFRQYVILREKGFYNRLLSQMVTLNRILRDHNRHRPGTRERLASLGRELEETVELIKQYEPVPTEETLVPVDDEDSDGER